MAAARSKSAYAREGSPMPFTQSDNGAEIALPCCPLPDTKNGVLKVNLLASVLRNSAADVRTLVLEAGTIFTCGLSANKEADALEASGLSMRMP